MKLKWFLSVAALVATSLLLSGTESRATLVTLPAPLSVVNQNQALVGDKTFDFLSVTPAGTQPPTLSAITVVPETPGSGGTTVAPFGFGLNGSVAVASGANQTSDLSLTYTAKSSNGPITALNLTGTGSASVGSSISIAETVFKFDPVTGIVGGVIGTGTLFGVGTITIPFSQAVDAIRVVKDIIVQTGSTDNASANYSVVSQTFTQVVPEPASITMLGLGLIGLGGVLLRRRLCSV